MLKFIFNAVFWIAVVAAFTPTGFAAPADGAFARTMTAYFSAPAETTVHRTRAEAQTLCLRETQACDVINELARFTGLVAGVAAGRAEQALEERMNRNRAAPASLDQLLEDLPRERAAR
ncbi:MAG: hypothetical protein ACLFQ5_08485 [Oceanicaulis sp.]